jgi:hypothetical protein
MRRGQLHRENRERGEERRGEERSDKLSHSVAVAKYIIRYLFASMTTVTWLLVSYIQIFAAVQIIRGHSSSAYTP